MFICIQNSLKRKPLDEMVQLFQRPIIKVIRQTQNYGEAKSRANALIYTNNDFVLFLDSFVECLPGYLIQMINLLQEGVYFSRHSYLKTDKKCLIRIILIKLFHRLLKRLIQKILEFQILISWKILKDLYLGFPKLINFIRFEIIGKSHESRLEYEFA